MSNLLVNRVYQHLRNKTNYLLLAVTNESAENPEKFPKMAVYLGEGGEYWSRPLSEFQSNFELVSELGLRSYMCFTGLLNQNGKAFKETYLD